MSDEQLSILMAKPRVAQLFTVFTAQARQLCFRRIYVNFLFYWFHPSPVGHKHARVTNIIRA